MTSDVDRLREQVARAARLTKDEYFLGLADAASMRSTCTRRQVGAVLVDQDDYVVSTGYNGSPKGTPHCIDGHCPRGKLSYEEQPAFTNYGNCIADHAEDNAKKQAIRRGLLAEFPTMTLYVNCQPCEDCAADNEAVGIGRVVYPGSS